MPRTAMTVGRISSTASLGMGVPALVRRRGAGGVRALPHPHPGEVAPRIVIGMIGAIGATVLVLVLDPPMIGPIVTAIVTTVVTIMTIGDSMTLVTVFDLALALAARPRTATVVTVVVTAATATVTTTVTTTVTATVNTTVTMTVNTTVTMTSPVRVIAFALMTCDSASSSTAATARKSMSTTPSTAAMSATPRTVFAGRTRTHSFPAVASQSA